MKECNVDAAGVETVSAQEAMQETGKPKRYGAYVGLDVHKAVGKLIERLSKEYDGQVLLFCYEAGPCGYGLYRQIVQAGHEREVVAPSVIPKKAGERVKTDRRDALKLARYLRSGDLTTVWVLDQEQETMRDLCRARGDMKSQEGKAQQQLNAFVLRHGHHWPGDKKRWTVAH